MVSHPGHPPDPCHIDSLARGKENATLMDVQKLQRVVVDALEDVKAQDIKTRSACPTCSTA